jgi:lysozyme family protein
MADFNPAVAITLQHEGGYVNDPNDNGGETKYGITSKDLPGVSIATLSSSDATNYYRTHYWKPLYSEIISQEIANKLFDMGVLFGVGEAAYLLQRALNFLPSQWTKTFDEATLTATNEANADLLFVRYRGHLQAHANNLAAANVNDRGFLIGWLNRVNS